jgi:hypothetical protein
MREISNRVEGVAREASLIRSCGFRTKSARNPHEDFSAMRVNLHLKTFSSWSHEFTVSRAAHLEGHLR